MLALMILFILCSSQPVAAQDSSTVEFYEAMSPDDKVAIGMPAKIGYKARWYGIDDVITANMSVFITGWLLLEFDNITRYWVTTVIRNETADMEFSILDAFHPESTGFLQTAENITVHWGGALDSGQNYLGTLEFGGFIGFLGLIGAVVFFANRSSNND